MSSNVAWNTVVDADEHCLTSDHSLHTESCVGGGSNMESSLEHSSLVDQPVCGFDMDLQDQVLHSQLEAKVDLLIENSMDRFFSWDPKMSSFPAIFDISESFVELQECSCLGKRKIQTDDTDPTGDYSSESSPTNVSWNDWNQDACLDGGETWDSAGIDKSCAPPKERLFLDNFQNQTDSLLLRPGKIQRFEVQPSEDERILTKLSN
mmetsp:Transcript_63898/g.171182  ORF Transcript_63898/g.171182 Transcript_63898/m.171182 type:complete len:207 (-) Transcript_63898:56-676(-)